MSDLNWRQALLCDLGFASMVQDLLLWCRFPLTLSLKKTILLLSMPRRLLELFSGMGRAFDELGWEVTSLDVDPKASPTIFADSLGEY